ncbi:hypothetical protein DYQ86_18050 [Acidobacteria bacterium AB60]|nr:hypothetical protein DYQ86_18050 [Acidobacteria bacterium AB60]
MSPMEALLSGLIDYAGLYPPADLDMRTAVRNYLDYRSSSRSFALGRFILDAARLPEFNQTAGESIAEIPLSVIIGSGTSTKSIEDAISRGLRIESIEMQCREPQVISRYHERLPQQLDRYFEVPMQSLFSGAIDALVSTGSRAKLRMGGVAPDAFPSPSHVMDWLRVLADRRIPFKATAGLHHPIRGKHRLTAAADALSATMHGFLNLFCSAALVFNGQPSLGASVLEEDYPATFHLQPDRLGWLTEEWTPQQISTVRRRFFTSFGSCSFEEPLQDLEAMGWL